MIPNITHSTGSGNYLGYNLGDKKKQYQKVQFLAAEGVMFDYRIIDRLNQNWVDGDEKSYKAFRALAVEIANDFDEQFRAQASLNGRPKIRAINVSLSYSPADTDKVNEVVYDETRDEYVPLRLKMGREFLEGMGFGDIQYVAVSHLGTHCAHDHYAINTVRADGTTINLKYDFNRAQKLAVEIRQRYGLTPPDESLQRITPRAKEALVLSCTWEEYAEKLQEYDIGLVFTDNAKNGRGKGVSYTIGTKVIPGSKLHRSLSYGQVDAVLQSNLAVRQAKEAEEEKKAQEAKTVGEEADNAAAEAAKKAQEEAEKAEKAQLAQKAVKTSCSWEEYEKNLQEQGIGLVFSNYSKNGRGYGVSYVIGTEVIPGSKLHRSLSYGQVDAVLKKNLAARQAKEAEEERKAAAEAARIAQEEAEVARQAQEDAKQRQEETLKAKYWKIYNRDFKPLVDGIKKDIGDTLGMRDWLNAQIGECGKEITARYDRLSQIKKQIRLEEEEMQKASTSEGLWAALGGMVAAINPLAGLILALVGCMLAEADRRASYEIRKALYEKAKTVRTDIGKLKVQQSQLRTEKTELNDSLKKDKSALTELFEELDKLKETLDKPVQRSEQEVHDMAIRDLKQRFPFHGIGHMQYIIHGPSDASIFRAQQFRNLKGEKEIAERNEWEEKYEQARKLLKNKVMFVAGDRGPNDFYETLLGEQQDGNYRVGDIQIHEDGNITFGRELVFGDPALTEHHVPEMEDPVVQSPSPAPAVEIRPVSRPKEDVPSQEMTPASKHSTEPGQTASQSSSMSETQPGEEASQPVPTQKPSFEIVEEFTCNYRKYRIKKEQDGTMTLQRYDWDKSSVDEKGKYTKRRWYNKEKFTSFKKIGKDANGVYFKIKTLGGKTQYINQDGIKPSEKTLKRFGISLGTGGVPMS